MSTAQRLLTPPAPGSRAVVYPESDGEPMAENTQQYTWIERLKGGIEAACPDAFVAGDLLWYYLEGDPKSRVAPDVLVAFGRAPGDRGAYLQWLEDGVCPQVVVEVWSPGNTFAEQLNKLRLYERLGVQEFVTYDCERNAFAAFERSPAGTLEVAAASEPWTSPRTSCRFVPGEDTLRVYGPDGQIFRTVAEAKAYERELEAKAAESEAKAAESAAKADRLAEKLRAAGIDPEG